MDKNKIVTFRLTDIEFDELRDICDENKTTVSKFIRDAIVEKINSMITTQFKVSESYTSDDAEE